MPDHVIESAEGHSFFEQVTALQDRVAELGNALARIENYTVSGDGLNTAHMQHIHAIARDALKGTDLEN